MPPTLATCRADFPILQREMRPGVPLIYLDSTATAQKPASVIEAMNHYYRHSNANVHRGLHVLAEEATETYEGARATVRALLNAASTREVIFTRNATEAVNLVAHSWGRKNVRPGEVIVLTEMEHHANLVPWHMLAAETGARLEFIPVTADGQLDLSVYPALLALQPRLVAFTHMSNVLGTINPAAEIAAQAQQAGATVLVDAAQSVPHLPVDVQTLNADFVVFSAHKMCGPTGIGVLWGKEAVLEAMPPFLGGGDMIKRVHLRDFKPNSLPHKFEAGTPPIAEAAGLSAAIDYLQAIGLPAIHAHEQALTAYALERLSEVPGLTVFGPSAAHKGGVVSFTLDDIHPHDIAQVLDERGIAIRAGHHCAQPLHDRFDLPATARASFYLYTLPSDIEALVDGLYYTKRLFA